VERAAAKTDHVVTDSQQYLHMDVVESRQDAVDERCATVHTLFRGLEVVDLYSNYTFSVNYINL
jgi:hypothetical protein